MHTAIFLAFAALTGSAVAQSLSAGCTSALTAVATNPDAAACLAPASLISLASGGSSSSVVPVIDSWLGSLCSAPECSSATIAAIVQNVTSGCASDLSSLGVSSQTAASVTPLIQQYYPSVRQLVCLKDGNTNCITETLNGIQSAVGTLTVNNIIQILNNPPSSIPSNVTCSNCVKSAFNIVNSAIPGLVSDAIPSLNAQCGSSFTDGSNPSNIVETASTSTALAPGSSNTHSSASSVILLGGDASLSGLGASVTVLLSTIFVLLA